MNEPQHGDPVEAWTVHTHSILLICPKCRQPVSRPYQSYHKLDLPHVISCACGQSFGVKWQDKIQDAQVTIHTYVDIDIPEIDEEVKIVKAKIVRLGKAKPKV